MNYLLHGEDINLSRGRLADLKQRFQVNQIAYLGPQLSHLNLDLFGGTRFYVVEIHERRELKKINPQALLGAFRHLPQGVEAAVWFGFGLAPAPAWLALAKKYGFREIVSKKPQEVFALVDLFFREPNQKESKRNFYQKLLGFSSDKGDWVFLVQMLIRRVRQIVWASLGCESFKKLPPFSRRPVGREAAGFSWPALLDLYRKFVDLEICLKTSEVDLVSTLCLIYEGL